jgi:uncharacterized protein (TIGR02594 family)
MLHARWMEVAFAEVGVASFPEGTCNPRITAYHQGTTIDGHDDKVNWCSTFVHWTLAQVGLRGTGSALARSWLDWGEGLPTPQVGCITVIWRQDPCSWKGHVGFYLREDAEQVYLLGGNQQGSVREHGYPKNTVLAHRWPPPFPAMKV